MTVLKSATREIERQEVGRSGRDEGKIKIKLSEVITRIVSRGQNALIGEFKVAAGDEITSPPPYTNPCPCFYMWSIVTSFTIGHCESPF